MRSAVTVEHHSAVCAGNVRGCVIPARIFVSNDDVVYIIHGIQGNLIGFAEDGIGKPFHCGKSVLRIVTHGSLTEQIVVDRQRAVLIEVQADRSKVV